MYSKTVCLNELNRNHFYLLPLRLLLLPLNKNCFSNIVGFCVYIINTIIHGCLEIWNFSSRVQFDISRVSVANEWDIALNTRREIPYLRAPMYYCLFLTFKDFVHGRKARFIWLKDSLWLNIWSLFTFGGSLPSSMIRVSPFLMFSFPSVSSFKTMKRSSNVM